MIIETSQLVQSLRDTGAAAQAQVDLERDAGRLRQLGIDPASGPGAAFAVISRPAGPAMTGPLPAPETRPSRAVGGHPAAVIDALRAVLARRVVTG